MDIGTKARRLGEDQNVHRHEPVQSHQGRMQSLRGCLAHAGLTARRGTGFVAFHLLLGPEREDHVLYSSHTIWATQEEFSAWTKSGQFRAAHQQAGERKPLTPGHPEIQSVKTPADK